MTHVIDVAAGGLKPPQPTASARGDSHKSLVCIEGPWRSG